MSDRENQLVSELSNCIARHACWLDGRTFQKLAQRVAEGYFDSDDLDRVQLLSPEAAALADAMIEALRGTAHG